MPKGAIKPNFNLLKQQLDELVAKLQSDDLDVDQALAYYKQAEQLITKLKAYLLQAENSVKVMKLK
jgi:exodeoxyribonuclease VII small subunit